jgi:hypothetical protein
MMLSLSLKKRWKFSLLFDQSRNVEQWKVCNHKNTLSSLYLPLYTYNKHKHTLCLTRVWENELSYFSALFNVPKIYFFVSLFWCQFLCLYKIHWLILVLLLITASLLLKAKKCDTRTKGFSLAKKQLAVLFPCIICLQKANLFSLFFSNIAFCNIVLWVEH